VQYEDYKQEKPSIDKYLEALSPSEKEAYLSQIRDTMEEAYNLTKERLREEYKENLRRN
jgi:hypothetical protein